MRKLLNNPWIVTALAVVAVACAARSLWPARPEGVAPTIPAAANPTETQAPDALPATAATAALSSDDLTNLTGTAVRRDPFAPASRTASVATATEKANPDFVETVHLSALWAQDGVTYAVMNGNIVRPGDEIGRLKIESASADGVWLVHWKGRDHLALGDEFTLHTPATAPLGESNGAVLTSSL
ncbi:MAG TPA: hypothetical protein VG734_02940 [Lacunisphaera sp.]|nr:hypothetical protein [Lacunisphaera sp.]